MKVEIVREFKREDYESWTDFRYRVFKGVQEMLSKLEDAWLEEEGGEEWTVGGNEFYKFQIYLPSGRVRDISIDLIFPNEATVTISKPRKPTSEEKQYFKKLAETYNVIDDFKF